LGIQDTGGLFTTYEFLWRGTRREVEVLYENVREMTDDRLRGRPGTWSVGVDFPFDDANSGPADDLAGLRAYRGGSYATRGGTPWPALARTGVEIRKPWCGCLPS